MVACSQKGENKIYIWQGRKGVWGLDYAFIAVVGEDSCVKAKRTCAITVTLSGTVNYMDFQCILAMARF